ncbi:MAG: 2-isopropylmalate synthase [Euryarchaeota archaeon RBG_19FT_COMBO_69_17]|nr:MAG: 2-isopropylmalate synthase [Euryarchaeota archaeon RBG_19FT_COMBO_69_17]
MKETERSLFVSPYNEAVLGRHPDRKVRIFDTTLRDGEQTPGVALSTRDKLQIAQVLDDLGVDSIEAGFPVNSPGEFEAVKAIADAGLKAKICALNRCNQADLDASIKAEVDEAHVFIATSDIHLTHKLRMSREQVLEKAVWAVDYARAHGLVVEYSAEDATRTDIGFLKQVIRKVEEAKADRFDVADTVGSITPEAMRYIVRELRSVSRIPIAVHCHNDFGLATANSLAAVDAGAEQVHVTVNGIGERAGNASLEEVVMGLHAFFGITTGIDTTKLMLASKLVSRLTGITVQPNKAIVGDNAFAHESGIHVHGILGDASTYEPIRPDVVGRDRKIVVGKHTGVHSVESRLKEYGFGLTKEQLGMVTQRVKKLAEDGKQVDDAELLALAYDVQGKSVEGQRPIRLEEFTAITGFNFTPTATISLIVDGEKRRTSETGVGPIDAALKAMRSAVSKGITLDEFRLEAITGGSDSLCQVTVRLGDKEPAPVSAIGRAVGPDIVTTSVDAAMEALNRLLWAKAQIGPAGGPRARNG